MHSKSTKVALAGMALLAGSLWASGDTQANTIQAGYAEIGAETSIPYGWVDFCSRRPEECNVPRLPPASVKITNKTWALLDRINREVNAYIQPVSNLEHWGTILDHWDYPVDGKGDCKIYALYKRKLLLEAGLPRQALLMTIVRDLNDEGHTILTVETDRGEFVLDNLSEQVRPWTVTGYRFVKRQSQEDPNVWVAITNGNTKLSMASQ
jgi:predicted transglutaminase-like cysteine proteinase